MIVTIGFVTVCIWYYYVFVAVTLITHLVMSYMTLFLRIEQLRPSRSDGCKDVWHNPHLTKELHLYVSQAVQVNCCTQLHIKHCR